MKIILSIVLLLFSWYLSHAQEVSETRLKNLNVSVSINDTDDDYKYSAVFNSEKTEKIRDLLEKTFGKPTENYKKTSVWESKGYTANISEGKVVIRMDKRKVAKSFIKKIENLVEEISDILGSPQTPPVPPKPGF